MCHRALAPINSSPASSSTATPNPGLGSRVDVLSHRYTPVFPYLFCLVSYRTNDRSPDLEHESLVLSGTEARLFRLGAGGNAMQLAVWSTSQRGDLYGVVET